MAQPWFTQPAISKVEALYWLGHMYIVIAYVISSSAWLVRGRGEAMHSDGELSESSEDSYDKQEQEFALYSQIYHDTGGKLLCTK